MTTFCNLTEFDLAALSAAFPMSEARQRALVAAELAADDAFHGRAKRRDSKRRDRAETLARHARRGEKAAWLQSA